MNEEEYVIAATILGLLVVYYGFMIVLMTRLKCYITAVILIISRRCDKVTLPALKMQPSHFSALFFLILHGRVEIEFPSVFRSSDRVVSS